MAHDQTTLELAEELEQTRAKLRDMEDALRKTRQSPPDTGSGSSDGAGESAGQTAPPTHRALLDALPEGVVILSPAGTIVDCNLPFARMVACARHDVVARDFADFIRPAEHDRFRSMLQQATDAIVRREFELVDGDGRAHPAQLCVRFGEGRETESACMIVADLSGPNHIEQELRSERDQALESARAKSDFLASMSHEIRTPLNSVLGVAELLLDTRLNAKQRDYLDMMQTSGEALLHVINQVLDYSKIASGKVVFARAEFDPRIPLENAVKIAHGAARRKKLALSMTCADDLPLRVRGDASAIEQVLINLIQNAVKFTERGSVVVSAAVAEQSGDSVTLRFSVRDTGIGIDKAAQALLFQPFSQVQSANTRRFGGTGLGLAISAHLVQLMGGHIAVESTPGLGSTFSFAAVLEKVAAPQLTPKAPSYPAARTPRPGTTSRAARLKPTGSAIGANAGHLLLAEDDLMSQIVARHFLEKLGFSVRIAANGIDALRTASSETYDLVLMDCQMPEMDGYEATAEIRRREPPGRHLPIIAMTANAMEGDREKCLAAGMDDYVAKPITAQRLKDVLDRWIKPGGRARAAKPRR